MPSKYSEIRSQFLNKTGISTTSAGFTEDMLKQFAKEAHRWATSLHKWPFTEGRVSTTFTGAEEWQFEGYKADSIRMVVIGDKRFQKLNYDDYLIMKEDDSSCEDRVFSDFGRLVIVNPNADASGTLWAYGQYQPNFDVTDEDSKTVFSDYDDEGNAAIVEEMISLSKTRDQLHDEALMYHQKAEERLEKIWKTIQAEQYAYQTSKARGGMFKRIDVLNGGLAEDINKRDQFNI